VVFAHGSGSSRRSPRNVQVAERLQVDGFGTLAFDLLTEVEARDRGKVFDIALLAARLEGTVGWLRGEQEAGDLAIAFFGASTGAAAALVAAGHLAGDVAAVVSRGGRPDLAGEALAAVTAPTLLIVGGADREVLELNRQAQARMRCETRLEIVPGATHLFEEPGALERVAELAAAWFSDHAGRTPRPRRVPSPARPARRSRR
jgi:putative phosphoribosyl transferase